MAVWRRVTRRPRFTIGATVVLLGASLAVIIAVGGLPGCNTDPPPVPTSNLPVEQVQREPVVRIRVGRGVEAVNVASSNGYRIGPATATSATDMRSLAGAARGPSPRRNSSMRGRDHRWERPLRSMFESRAARRLPGSSSR